MAIPMMSLVVVIKGPVAIAGSIFIRLSIIGIVEPTAAAKQTTINNENPDVKALPTSSVRYHDMPASMKEQIIPFKNATLNSFQSRTRISVVCIAPVASHAQQLKKTVCRYFLQVLLQEE